jgi:hypothetical protein
MADNQFRLSEGLGMVELEQQQSVKIEPEEFVQEEYLDTVEMVEEEFLDVDDIIEEDQSVYNSQPYIKQEKYPTFIVSRKKDGQKSEEFFTCRLCDDTQVFTSRYRYRLHLKEEHPERNQNKFWILTSTADTKPKDTVCSKDLCHICEKWITTSSLENHMKRMHSNKYEFFCDLCPMKFKVKRDIQYHVKKHMATEFR